MIRTQISITEEQAGRLRRFAAAEGVSQSAVIRRSLDMFLQDEGWARSVESARAVVGAYRSEPSSTAADHDSVLDEAFSA